MGDETQEQPAQTVTPDQTSDASKSAGVEDGQAAAQKPEVEGDFSLFDKAREEVTDDSLKARFDEVEQAAQDGRFNAETLTVTPKKVDGESPQGPQFVGELNLELIDHYQARVDAGEANMADRLAQLKEHFMAQVTVRVQGEQTTYVMNYDDYRQWRENGGRLAQCKLITDVENVAWKSPYQEKPEAAKGLTEEQRKRANGIAEVGRSIRAIDINKFTQDATAKGLEPAVLQQRIAQIQRMQRLYGGITEGIDLENMTDVQMTELLQRNNALIIEAYNQSRTLLSADEQNRIDQSGVIDNALREFDNLGGSEEMRQKMGEWYKEQSKTMDPAARKDMLTQASTLSENPESVLEQLAALTGMDEDEKNKWRDKLKNCGSVALMALVIALLVTAGASGVSNEN